MTSIGVSIPRFPTPQSPRARIDSRIAAASAAGTISQTDETALEAAVTSIGQSLRGSTPNPSSTSSTTDAGSAAAGTARTSFKDKLDSLIDAQVKGGTLTDAQATELKGFFAQGVAPKTGPGQPGADGPDGAAASGTVAAAGVGQTGQASGTHHAHHHGGSGGGGAIAAIMAALDGSDSADGSTDTSAIDALTGATSGSTAASTASTGTAAATTNTIGSTTGSAAIAAQQIDKLIGFLEKMRESIGSAQTYGAASANSSGTDAAGMVFSGIA